MRPLPELVTNRTAKGDFTLMVEEHQDRLVVGAEYATALFEPATVARMLTHLGVLLEAVVADPGRRLSQLPLLSDAERHRQLVEWNDTAAPVPEGCLHELFEAQAAERPDALAVWADGETLTYGELDAQANQVAHHLVGLGVGPEVLVGVCMGRSLRRLVAIMGILKAGGAYVPLDPTYPPERLAFMIDDSAAPVVIAEEATAGVLEGQATTVVHIDRDWPAIATHPQSPPDKRVTNHNLAYVIYTSGSTGRPKGVLIEHRSVTNYIFYSARDLKVGPDDRMLQLSTLSFDISVPEVFMPLAAGGSMHLATDQSRLSPLRLAQLIRDQKITVAILTPPIATLLAPEAGTFSDLRVIIVGGEAFSSELVRAWARPGRRFYNGYGPTEATVTVTLNELQGDEGSVPPIGRPMVNQRAYVLDAHHNLVPVGVPGQLYLGGVGLARGYLNRPELTAERFVPNPFSDEPDYDRLYATGDLVRYLPDGNLVFLGRLDHQVKVRGYRIELGEIEAALEAHPEVTQAVVVAREDASGNKTLVGYVSSEAPTPPEPTELRRHLERHLPAYMVPAHLMVLEAFPLSPTGKIDRAALPAPEQTRSAASAPTTLVEGVVAELFAEVLGLESIGADDGFFDLGGNSLQVMQLLARLRDTFEVDVEVAAIFQASTVAGVAELLRTAHGVSDEDLGDEEWLTELEGLFDDDEAALLGSSGENTEKQGKIS